MVHVSDNALAKIAHVKLALFALFFSALNYSSAIAASPDSVNQTSAQAPKSDDGQFIHYLPTAGYSAFSVTGTDVDRSVDSNNGFTGGLLIDLGESEIKFETGLLYLQAGYRFPYDSGTQIVVHDSYVGLPLLAKFQFAGSAEGDQSGFFIKTGAIPIYLVSEETQLVYKGYIMAKNQKQFTKTNDVLAHVGVGYTSERFSYPLTIEIGGYRGLVPSIGDAKIYNSGYTVTMAISL